MMMPVHLPFFKILLYSFLITTALVYADHNSNSMTPLLQKGDRVALVGGGLIERARLNGYFESALTLGAGPKVSGLKFRNLGWSGDTVFNDARSYFGKPKEGRDRLKKIIAIGSPAWFCSIMVRKSLCPVVGHGRTNPQRASVPQGAGMRA